MLGLGCENSSIAVLQERLGRWDSQRVAFLECQAVEDELAEGERLLRELADRAAADRREPVGADELVVGLKCGGSDGLSGITANPLAGRVTDRVIAMGGSALLAEVPEMFGAEGVLFRRCADEGVTRALPALVEEFKDYFTRHGQVVYENPSPGNKAGGITTLEEKSLGCVQKGGNTPIADVLHYGETVRRRGLTVLQTPGNDLVSATGLAAAGPTDPLYHRAGHSLRRAGANPEAGHQHRPGQPQGRLDRLRRRRPGPGGRLGAPHSGAAPTGAGHGLRRPHPC